MFCRRKLATPVLRQQKPNVNSASNHPDRRMVYGNK
jgi:hypothetical protein